MSILLLIYFWLKDNVWLSKSENGSGQEHDINSGKEVVELIIRDAEYRIMLILILTVLKVIRTFLSQSSSGELVLVSDDFYEGSNFDSQPQ